MFCADNGWPPTAVPFIGSMGDLSIKLFQQIIIGFIPLRPFPAAGFKKYGIQFFFQLVHGTFANAPSQLPLFRRMYNAIYLIKTLFRPGNYIFISLGMVIKTGYVQFVTINFWNTMGHPFSQQSAGTRRFFYPDSSCGPKPFHFRRFTQ